MGRIDTSDLMRSFRESRNQGEEIYEPPKKERQVAQKVSPRYITHKNVSSDKYQLFLEKYWNLDNTIDDFKPQDLMYYFREKAKESGVKYVIANMKRDLGIFKRLLSNYNPREICLMVEFIFFSDQNYLNPQETQPTVLVSQWCNTIYRDAMLWVDDEYVPVVKTPSKLGSREWGKQNKRKVSIGDWK